MGGEVVGSKVIGLDVVGEVGHAMGGGQVGQERGVAGGKVGQLQGAGVFGEGQAGQVGASGQVSTMEQRNTDIIVKYLICCSL